MADFKPYVDVIDEKQARDIAERFEGARGVRLISPRIGIFLFWFLVVFATYHYFTAGFGLPVDHWHMGFHLSGVLLMIYILFPMWKPKETALARGWYFPGGVPLHDWLIGILGVVASLWIGFSWEGFDFSIFGYDLRLTQQALRQGNPAPIDVFFGSALVVIVLEATRRTVGPVLPIIALCFMAFALLGPYMPFTILKHPGATWNQFVNNIYFPSEGMFGIPLWVVSTVVFHFVMFGTVAQRMGLGKLFVDISTVVAGRYVGGPAKVSVVSSGMTGTTAWASMGPSSKSTVT